MADSKITALTELTTPVGTDILPVVGDPSGTPVTKKISINTLLFNFLRDGWIPCLETFTYATATTVTVPGDQRTKYYKGMKVKLTQTTVKYFVVAADPTYSSPDTTLTLHPYDSTTSVADAAITLNYYSTSENPTGFPQKPKCSVYLGSAQDNVANATHTWVLLDTENYDIGSNFAVDTHLFTAPVTGYYNIKGSVGYNATTDAKIFMSEIFINSTAISQMYHQSSVASSLMCMVSTNYLVTKGQTIGLKTYHNVGAATPDLLLNYANTFMNIDFMGV